MSTDLSRPLVPAMGLHDALDGFISFRYAQQTARRLGAKVEPAGLPEAIESLSALCLHRNWTTDDPLGIGGLLFDACRLSRLPRDARFDDAGLLEEITDACRTGLQAFAASGHLDRPAARRLAFRELGLAIGLTALPLIASTIALDGNGIGKRPALRRAIDRILPYESFGKTIVEDWSPHAERPDENWQAH